RFPSQTTPHLRISPETRPSLPFTQTRPNTTVPNSTMAPISHNFFAWLLLASAGAALVRAREAYTFTGTINLNDYNTSIELRSSSIADKRVDTWFVDHRKSRATSRQKKGRVLAVNRSELIVGADQLDVAPGQELVLALRLEGDSDK